jgi:hypothetical protein
MRFPKPRDITIDGKRFIEVENNCCASNGAIPECAGRMCHFNRRGECWIDEYTKGTESCHWPYLWRQVDSDGYVLDRDGWKIGIRIDAERYRIDENGVRYTYGTLWKPRKNSKHNDDLIKY